MAGVIEKNTKDDVTFEGGGECNSQFINP